MKYNSLVLFKIICFYANIVNEDVNFSLNIHHLPFMAQFLYCLPELTLE